MAQLQSTLRRIKELADIARPAAGAKTTDPYYQPALNAQRATYEIMKQAAQDGILPKALEEFKRALPDIIRTNAWASHLMLFPTFDAAKSDEEQLSKLILAYGDQLEAIAQTSPHYAVETLRFLYLENNKINQKLSSYLFYAGVKALPVVANGYCGQTNALGLGELLFTKAESTTKTRALRTAFAQSVSAIEAQLRADPKIPTTDRAQLSALLSKLSPPASANHVPIHDPDDVIDPVIARGLGPAAVYLGALRLQDQIKATVKGGPKQPGRG